VKLLEKTKSKNLLLYGHFGSRNRGCEAIVRGTTVMLREVFESPRIKLVSNDDKADSEAMGCKCPEVVSDARSRRGSLKHYIFRIIKKLKLSEELAANVKYGGNKKHIRWAYAGISIGGDTYCYNSIEKLCYFNRMLKKLCKKNFLWGCSIEPADIKSNEVIRSNLKLFDAIFARESITYSCILESGLNSNVYLYPDPAFAMKLEKVALPGEWLTDKMVGLNLSNMILNYHNDRDVMLNAVMGLIEYILKNTDYSIVLIPHVIVNNNDDRECLGALKGFFPDESRLLMTDGRYNAPQTKYLISSCDLFVGARTHSVIAAYSSCVPALALGYSVKARGIAQDIFGDWKDMVVRQEDITGAEDLIEPFKELLRNKDSIKKHLCDTMPGYTKKLAEAAILLKELI